jgi:hypothetical protein
MLPAQPGVRAFLTSFIEMNRHLRAALLVLASQLLLATQVLPVRAGLMTLDTATHVPVAPCHVATDEAGLHEGDQPDGDARAAEHAALCAALCAVSSQMAMTRSRLPAPGAPRLPAPAFARPLALGEAGPPETPPPIR